MPAAKPESAWRLMIHLPKRRILCIDRDSVSLRLRSAIVETAGFAAIARTSIEAGQQLLRKQEFDAVVLDDNTLDGDGALTRLGDVFPAKPIILLSSSAAYPRTNGFARRVRRFNKQDGPAAFVAALRECMVGDETGDGAGGRKRDHADDGDASNTAG